MKIIFFFCFMELFSKSNGRIKVFPKIPKHIYCLIFTYVVTSASTLFSQVYVNHLLPNILSLWYFSKAGLLLRDCLSFAYLGMT